MQLREYIAIVQYSIVTDTFKRDRARMISIFKCAGERERDREREMERERQRERVSERESESE